MSGRGGLRVVDSGSGGRERCEEWGAQAVRFEKGINEWT
jgi:hypothetical protein